MTESPDTSGPAPQGRGRLVVAVVAVIAAVALFAAAWWAVGPGDAIVDGRSVWVGFGATPADLVRGHSAYAPWGDFVAASGHVLRLGGGLPPTFVDGQGVLAPTGRIHPRDHVSSVRGLDITESVVRTTAPEPPPVEYQGAGPDETVISSGTAGVALIVEGEVSRDVVEKIIVIAPVTRIVRRQPFPPGTKLAVLTFDDGPWPGQTEAILAILKGNDVKATFFMLSAAANRHKDLARKVLADGHLIGNHSVNHKNLAKSTPDVVRFEIVNAGDTIQNITGYRPAWFRPPGGDYNATVLQIMAESGVKLAMWNVDTNDWRKTVPPREIVGRAVAGQQSTKVVLMHDGGGDRSRTIAALPQVIIELKARGYRFVTFDQLPADQVPQ
jgi:peptidoglycan/xylan/chitin deacetylase (PgdA/CDA1 family)